MTLTSANSACAALGRSPPRMVMVRRMISPRRSRPASANAPETMYDTSGLEATTTWAPGTSFGSNRPAHLKKKDRTDSSCSGVSVVNRGSGDRA